MYYEGDTVWHTRYLLSLVDRASWIIITPDGDIYSEEVSDGNPDWAAWRLWPAGGGVPFGVDANAIYGFNPPPNAATLQNLISEGHQHAAQERARLGLAQGGQGGGVAGAAHGADPQPVGGASSWSSCRSRSTTRSWQPSRRWWWWKCTACSTTACRSAYGERGCHGRRCEDLSYQQRLRRQSLQRVSTGSSGVSSLQFCRLADFRSKDRQICADSDARTWRFSHGTSSSLADGVPSAADRWSGDGTRVLEPCSSSVHHLRPGGRLELGWHRVDCEGSPTHRGKTQAQVGSDRGWRGECFVHGLLIGKSGRNHHLPKIVRMDRGGIEERGHGVERTAQGKRREGLVSERRQGQQERMIQHHGSHHAVLGGGRIPRGQLHRCEVLLHPMWLFVLTFLHV